MPVVCKLTAPIEKLVMEYSDCAEENRDNRAARWACLQTLTDKGRGVGLKELGSGIHRAGYEFKHGRERCAVKVANPFFHEERGVTPRGANLREVNTYKVIPEAIKSLFAPITQYDKDGRYIVLPRVTRLDSLQGERWSGGRLKETIKTRLEKEGYECVDLHGGNIGVMGRKKQPVIIDYGFGVGKCRRRGVGGNISTFKPLTAIRYPPKTPKKKPWKREHVPEEAGQRTLGGFIS